MHKPDEEKSELERLNFEGWIQSAFPHIKPNTLLLREKEGYGLPAVQTAWCGWMARALH